MNFQAVFAVTKTSYKLLIKQATQEVTLENRKDLVHDSMYPRDILKESRLGKV